MKMRRERIVVFLLILLVISKSYSENYPDMIRISGGEFVMGDNKISKPLRVEADGIPDLEYFEHRVKLDNYNISKYEVTYEEYFAFLEETGYMTDGERKYREQGNDKNYLSLLKRSGFTFNPDGFWKSYNAKLYPKYPITRITYNDAMMYCSWLSKKTGKTYRLPTEAEWEYAVTGGEMQYFPWGNDYKKLSDSESVEDIIDTSFDKDIYSVDQYSLDRSIYGVCGMYGNAGEWCLDAYDPEYYFFAAYENPLQIIRKYLGDMSVRGSVGYRLENDTQGVKRRRFKSPVYNTNVMGFRIVEEVEQTVFNKGNISESIFYYRKGNIIVPKTIVYEKPEIKSDRLFEIDKDVEVKIYLKSIKKEKQEDWYCVEVIGVDKSEGLTGWIVGSELEIQEIVFKS